MSFVPGQCNWCCIFWLTELRDTWVTCPPETWEWSRRPRWLPPPEVFGQPRWLSLCGLQPQGEPSRLRAEWGSLTQSSCRSRWCAEECSLLCPQPIQRNADTEIKCLSFNGLTWGSAPACSNSLVVDEHGNLQTSFVWKSSRQVINKWI